MRKISIVLVTLCAVHFSYSQINQEQTCDTVLNTGIDYYKSGAYAKSIKTLDSILSDCDENMRVEINKYLAFNYIAIGDEPTAIVHFKKALGLDPNLELDESTSPAKAISVFKAAKKELAHESGGCSCFIPGIGQFMKGDDTKARVIIAASSLSLATAIVTWAGADSKHNHYLSLGPDEIDEIERAYDDYNRWRKASIIAATTFVGIYVYSILDATLSQKTPDNSHRKTSRLNVDSNGKTISISYLIDL